MGAQTGQAMAEAVQSGDIGLRAALRYHLSANHYPPLPVEYVDVAKQVIERLGAGDDPETLAYVEIPAATGVVPREAVQRNGVLACDVHVLADILHLWVFINGWDYEEGGEYL